MFQHRDQVPVRHRNVKIYHMAEKHEGVKNTPGSAATDQELRQ